MLVKLLILNIQNKYLRKLSQARFGEKRKVFEQANAEGIWIIDNGGKIADAQRHCVNARIQGSAADIIKIAMVKVYNELKSRKLKSRLILQVHDELLIETHVDEIDEVRNLLVKCMEEAAQLDVPLVVEVKEGASWFEAK